MINTRFAYMIFTWLCFLLTQPAFASTAKWWDNKWEIRIPIVINATDGVLPKKPVVVPWSRFKAQLGNNNVRLSSMRLVSGGKAVVFQINHRDSKGHYITGNMTLDPFDELVFVAPAKQRTQYFLYLSRKPMPPVVYPSNIQARALRDNQAHWKLATAGLSINVQGPAPVDPSANPPAHIAKGAVTGMSWQWKSITGQSNNWSVFMNGHPFPTDTVTPWQALKLVVDGPVHKVIGTTCNDSIIKAADGTTILQAAVTRYFSMFSGVPLYDVEDIIECSAAQGNWTGVYSDRLILGHRPNVKDTLWEGSSGKPNRFPLNSKDIPHTPDGNFDTTGELVNTDKAANCWYGWFDENAKSGIAVFYGSAGSIKPAQIGFRSGWAMWSSENWMTYTYTGLSAPTNLRHRFRVVGINNTTPELLDREYSRWKAASTDVTIGKIQRRK